MTIQEQLSAELIDAMKAQDAPRRDVIRQVQTEIAIAKSRPDFSGEVDDALCRKVIASYVKKMAKSRAEYADLGERGEAVAAAIDELAAAGDEKAAGRVTGHLMKSHGKDLDGALVSRVVREELAGG